MKKAQTPRKPKWLDPSLYSFESHYLELEAGTVHYVDEGEGEVLLFVHGTPTWSFLYRHQIKELSNDYRCVAPDHLGFGLSEKPSDFPGTPEAHAENLARFIEKLNLQNITLIVHDFGGPIGLSYAVQHPENIKRIVLFNTWLWETESNPEVQKIDKILQSRLGSFLYLYMNFSPKVLLKKGFHHREKLTKTIHKHYINVFPNKSSRYGLLNIGKSLLGSSDWYQTQWKRLDAIKDKPFLILWGMHDQFLGPTFLKRWEENLGNAEVYEFDAGHFIQEEKSEVITQKMRNFVTREHWIAS